eukprot:TRINITY_DN19877_c0_g1_i1.p2 TRINITY_DN19877_c0_g1~~TRINITY_DN19877_c0_g1_i1.p2  ORF type:complete len:268 (-),score=53.65 TRINITY_DN19877_c0_g1_i1:6-809(-)
MVDTKNKGFQFNELIEEVPKKDISEHPKVGEERDKSNSGPSPKTATKLVSSNYEDVISQERCPLCKQIFYSEYYKYFYLVLLLCTLGLTIWIIADFSRMKANETLHVCEIIINIFLICDTLVRLTVLGCALIESITLLLCVFAIAVSLVWADKTNVIKGVEEEVLLMIICCIQYIRIALLIKESKEKQQEDEKHIDLEKVIERKPSIVLECKGVKSENNTPANNKNRVEKIEVAIQGLFVYRLPYYCLLYTSPSPRDATLSRMPSSA